MQTLRLFCDVARLRSFSDAAALHGITQSAASQRVGQLEKRLNVAFFDRSVRPMTLTEAGELFWREVQELVDRYDRLERRVQQLHAGPEGQVTVAAIYSAGIGLLNQIKDRFEAAYPKVSVRLDYKSPEDVHEAVRNKRCDLGILSYPERWRDVDYIPLRNEVMAVVCSPSHRLAGRTRVHASELAAWTMVSFEPDLPVAQQILRYFKEQHIRPRIKHVFDNIDTIKGVVEVTDCFAIVPKRTVLREVAAGRLAVVELEPELLRPIGIVHRRRKSRSGHGESRQKPASGVSGASDVSRPAAQPVEPSLEHFSPAAQLFVAFLLEHAGPKVDSVDEVEARGRELVGGRV